MVQFSTLYQLETLNEVLAQIGKPDPELSENARRALLFYQKESGKSHGHEALKLGVERLITLYFGQPYERVVGVEYWHIEPGQFFGDLWVRSIVKERLLRLAGYDGGLFLITGLRQSVLEGREYWTERCNQEFLETKDWIESIIADRVSVNQNLSLLIL